MPGALQEIVDRLGNMLQRSVAVDDPDLRIIVYSHHYGDEDPARLRALVRRGAAEPMVEYLAGHRIHTWRTPRYMDADEPLGLKGRLVVPLWEASKLLGFLWVIVDEKLPASEFEAVMAQVQAITGILARRVDEQETILAQRAARVTGLLDHEAATREGAARLLAADRDFVMARSYTFLLIHTDPGPGDAPVIGQGVLRLAVRQAMSSRLGEGHALAEVESGTAVLLGTRNAPGSVELEELCERIHREIRIQAGVEGPRVVIGAGSGIDTADNAHASFDQAGVAVRVACGTGVQALTWEGMGPSALLPVLVRQLPEPHLLPAPFQRLLTDQTPDMLRLLEVYLECAGNAVDAAEKLHLHRSSVYYNIGRFQKATGWDLGDGNSRFALHLWLKTRKGLGSGPSATWT